MAEAYCSQCGGAIGAADRFCPACGTAIEPAVAEPAQAAPVAAPAVAVLPADETRLARYGRVAKIVALLAFLLPWVTISCAGHPIASVSGARLAAGVFSLTNPSTGVVEHHSSSPNIAIAIAAALIVLALLLSFAGAVRAAATAGLVCCAGAAALSAYAVLIEIPGRLGESLHRPPGGGNEFGASFDDSVARVVSVDSAVGFWIAIFALAAACFIDWRLLQRPGR